MIHNMYATRSRRMRSRPCCGLPRLLRGGRLTEMGREADLRLDERMTDLRANVDHQITSEIEESAIPVEFGDRQRQ